MRTGKSIYDWIMERLTEGRTVYIATALRITYVRPKDRWAIRLNGAHCELARGRHWDSINGCNLTARFD